MALLEVRDLEVSFTLRKATTHAVRGVSYDVDAGQTLGIVGESGCGKSVTSLAVLGLLPRQARVTNGSVRFAGQDLIGMTPRRLRHLRGNDIAMVFQDPMSSLNPSLTIGRQLTETLRRHLDLDGRAARTEAQGLLERVGIPNAARRLRSHPHQLSGGMRQRVMIAMAIACRPKVLIADEPTTALDVTIQAQILELLRDLVATEGMALVLITHDLGVVAGVCDRTHVMYAGRFVETGRTEDVFAHPRHPYTFGLLRSVPRLDGRSGGRLDPIGGAPPDLKRDLVGCAFAPRCAYASDRSREEAPTLAEVAPGHEIACWNPVPEADIRAAAGIGPSDGEAA